jgi:hypothetical protein
MGCQQSTCQVFQQLSSWCLIDCLKAVLVRLANLVVLQLQLQQQLLTSSAALSGG